MSTTKIEELSKKAVTDFNTPDEMVTESVTEQLQNDTTSKPKRRTSNSKSSKPPHTVRMITATSKVATELNSVWYSFSYTETREINEGANIDAERQDLWNTVHGEVDSQVQYTIDSIQGNVPAEPEQPQNQYQIPPQYDFENQ